MGYRIEYNGATVKRKKVYLSKSKRKGICVGVAALLFATAMMLPAARRCVKELLLPGDADVTAAALSGLVENLSDGGSVGEAVHTFCVEILAGDA